MPITIISVDKKRDSLLAESIERYKKRLKRGFEIKWVLLGNSQQKGLSARQNESEDILSRLPAQAYVILLDERGKNIDSPSLAKILEEQINHSREIVFVIGGAYGVNDAVRERADFVWSLSKLVFPHQLVRLILTEQIYRAQSIIENSPYHHI